MQQLDFEPVPHDDSIFSVLIDGWTLLWWGFTLALIATAWWWLRRRRAARRRDGG